MDIVTRLRLENIFTVQEQTVLNPLSLIIITGIKL